MMSRILAPGLVALLVLAGCGGGTAPTSTGGEATVTGAATTPATTAGGATDTVPALTEPATTTDPIDATVAPTTFTEAIGAFGAGQVVNPPIARFESPSGNFYCSLELDGSPNGCELTRVTLDPGPDVDCPPGVSGVGRIEFDATGVRALCNTDSIRTGASAPVLEYGQIAQLRGSPIACLSRRIGMTCIDSAARHGFFVNTDGYVIF